MGRGQRFTEEFRVEAVRQVTERGFGVKDVSERLGVSPHSLYQWIKRYGVPTEQRLVKEDQASRIKAHADFVFAVAGEEFGLWMCIVIVALFMAIIIRFMMKATQSSSLFIMLGATGLAVQFSLQAFINMASALHLIPTKGMTMPFISYGGSSMVALAICAGMLLAFTRKRHGLQDWAE